MFCYTYRSVPCSAIIREAAACRKWELTLTHNRTKCREWEILEHSVLNGTPWSNLPLRAQGPRWKRRQTDCKSQRERMAPKNQCLSTTTGLTHISTHCGSMHKVCSFKPAGGRAERGKFTWDPTSNRLTKNCLQLVPVCQGNISFLQWSLIGHVSHTSGWVLCLPVDVNTK